MAATDPGRLWFTAKDDARDGCIMIGFTRIANSQEKPVFFSFETGQMPSGEVKTTISANGGNAVASLEWALRGEQLGLVDLHVGVGKQSPMTWFIMRGSAPNGRLFSSMDNRRYEWRKSDDRGSYDLYSSPDTQIASFRREQLKTPVGPAWGVMMYSFDNDVLLLESLVALSLNRWMDERGM